MADDAVTPKPEAVAPMMSVNLEDAEAPNETAVGASDGGGDEEALLMSGVTVDLVDWPKKARPMECTLLALSAILLLVGLLGDDWVFESLSGTQNHAGLAGTTGPSGFSCVRTVGDLSPEPAICAAGRAAGGFGWTAFSINLILGGYYVLEVLDELGMLAAARAKVPPAAPLHLAVYVPMVCWTLLLLFVFLALLVYALLAGSSVNGVLINLGSSYGAVRLDLLLLLLGLSVHLSLVHKVGEDHVVSMLDSLRGHWGHMSMKQQLSQVLLLLALLCNMLLWLRRVEWGMLLIIYGMWAHNQNSHEHLSIFSCGAIFSVCTDALTLASDAADNTLIEVMTWFLLLTKMGVVGILVSSKSAVI